MRSARVSRRSPSGRRARALPVVSRLTVRGPARALPGRPEGDRLRAALQTSREALLDVERQLGALLEGLREPSPALLSDAVDRLAAVMGRAEGAVGHLDSSRTPGA